MIMWFCKSFFCMNCWGHEEHWKTGPVTRGGQHPQPRSPLGYGGDPRAGPSLRCQETPCPDAKDARGWAPCYGLHRKKQGPREARGLARGQGARDG